MLLARFAVHAGRMVRIIANAFVIQLIAVHSVSAEVIVDDEPRQLQRSSAVASDIAPVSVEDVAREVLQLQQQMGGSVVEDRPQLQGWGPNSGPVTPREAPARSAYPPLGAAVSNRAAFPGHAIKVDELREAAWQLDTTAHRLEKLDLYDQADALRSVASRLRRDAREMKQRANSSAAERLRFVPPSSSTTAPGKP